MKTKFQMLMPVLAALAIQSVASAAILDAPADESNAPAEKKIVVQLNGAGDGHAFVWHSSDGVADAQNVLIETAGDDAPHHVVLRHLADGGARNIEAGGPWIGVQFGPVPKPLAAHLPLQPGQGQMVLNVLKDSPADIAGIQQYDVITAIDGVETTTDMGAFLDQIRDFAPNDVTSLSLIRNGSPTIVSLTIGSRPDDASAFGYKYESDIEDLAQGGVFRRGGIMRKGAGGDWVFDALHGDDDHHAIWQALPEFDDENLNAMLSEIPFGMQRDVTVQSINGNEVRIERGDDGQITVTKVTKNGDDEESTTATYADEEAFESADPEAHASYKNKFTFRVGDGGNYSMMMKPFGGAKMYQFRMDDEDFDVDFKLDGLEGLDGRIELLLERAHDSLNDGQLGDDISERIEDAMKRGEQIGRRLRVFKSDAADGSGAHQSAIVIGKKAMTSIMVGPDGAVTVMTQNGDEETNERFDSVEQLKTSRPDLYKQYGRMLEGVSSKTKPAP